MRLALIAVALISSAAAAQDDPQRSADGSAVMAQMTQQLSAPEPAPTLSVTPEKARLLNRYLDDGMRQGMQAMAQITYTKMKNQMLNVPGAMSNAQKAQMSDAFTKAFNPAMASRLRRAYDATVTYFAVRMNEEDLKSAVDYYSTGLGYKSQHNFKGMTPEERQENGQFVLDHPAIEKFVKTGLGYAVAAQARRKTEDPIFYADFNSRFCGNLAADHLKMTTCPSPFRIAQR